MANKLRTSTWLLNVNTNSAAGTMHELLAKALDDVLGDLGPYIVHKQDMKARYSKYVPDVKRNEDIESVEIAPYKIEVGPEKKYVHAHVPIQITHRSNIQLDYGKIKQRVDELTGTSSNIKGLVGDVQRARTDWDRFKDYATKDVTKGQN